MLIVSRDIVSPGAEGFVLFFVVILTARRAVFICGDTDVIVPCMIVPNKKERGQADGAPATSYQKE